MWSTRGRLQTVTTAPRSKAEQSEATKTALIGAARRLFTEHGFAGTSTEQIVAAANVTRGALYHHYRDKEDLFRAVFEELEGELAERVLRVALRGADPLARLKAGFDAFLEASLEPAVQRIVLLEGPSVLGWETWHEIDERHMFGLIDGGLREAMEAGMLDEQPTGALAHLLMGAAAQAALTVARAPRPRKARQNAGAALARLIDGLAVR
jgi:AcrR family transcriptional regulator